MNDVFCRFYVHLASRLKGGVVLLLGALLLLPSLAQGYATSPNEVLENWAFNDASGTPLDEVDNSAGEAVWSTDAFSTDGSGNLVIANGGDAWWQSASLEKTLPPGIFEVKWHISSMDLSHSSATDNCGVMFDLGDSMNVRVLANGSDNLALTVVGGPDGWKRLRVFSGRTLSDLTIRTVYDTVHTNAVVYSKLGNEPEQKSVTYSINAGDIAQLKAHFLAGKMTTSDYAKIDYLTLTMLDVDSDGDGISDSNDPDDDNDGYNDTVDAFPLDPTEWADNDGNGVGDNVQFDQSVLDEFYTKFGVTLSAEEHDALAKAVKPYIKEAWRIDAEARIEANRKANLTLDIVDARGRPLSGADVHVDLRKKKFLFGAALPTKNVNGEKTFAGLTTERYHELILDFCDAVGANNAFKPRLHEWFEYTLPDFMQWAEDNELPLRGHLLMWPSGADDGRHLPFSDPYDISNAWARAEANPTTENVDALRDIVDFQIADWAGKYKVTQWDVINENSDGNCMTNLLGEHCVVDWFTNAAGHVVNPDTELFVNDYYMITGDRANSWVINKVNRFKSLIEYLQANNAPLSGIGLQSHFGSYHVAPEEIYSRLNEFAAYGLNMVATEFDLDDGLPDSDKAMRTAEILTEYFSHPSVSQFLTWNFVREDPRALVNTDGIPRLHGLAWYYLTRMVWNTDTNLLSDTSGVAHVRAFKGTYDITVTYGGEAYVAALDLDEDGTFTIVLPDVGVGNLREEWRFGDAKGTALNQTVNSAGSATWSSTAFSTDGRGSLVLQSDGGNQWGISAPFATLTDGKYEMKWHVAAADLSRSTASDNCGLSLALGDLMDVRLYTGASNTLQVTIYNPSSWHLVRTFDRSLEDLTIRAVYDLNSDSVEVYTQLGDESEVFGGRYAVNVTGVADQIMARMLTANMADGDYLKLDYLTLRWLSPDSLFDEWAEQFALGSETNKWDDPDGDHLGNLMEYALGSNPASAEGTDSRLSQALQSDANGLFFHVVYARRKDAASRGLTYRIMQTQDLASETWSNANPIVEGTASIDSDFESVTNRVPVTEDASPLFIRVEVEQ